MLRQIYTVNATQVVVSDSHPEGIKSTITGFPKETDSRSYGATVENPNGNPDIALIVAQADFADEVKALSTANTPNRVQWTVTLEQANGVQLMRKSFGAFPDMTPQPAPEPNEEQGE